MFEFPLVVGASLEGASRTSSAALPQFSPALPSLFLTTFNTGDLKGNSVYRW